MYSLLITRLLGTLQARFRTTGSAASASVARVAAMVLLLKMISDVRSAASSGAMALKSALGRTQEAEK